MNSSPSIASSWKQEPGMCHYATEQESREGCRGQWDRMRKLQQLSETPKKYRRGAPLPSVREERAKVTRERERKRLSRCQIWGRDAAMTRGWAHPSVVNETCEVAAGAKAREQLRISAEACRELMTSHPPKPVSSPRFKIKFREKEV